MPQRSWLLVDGQDESGLASVSSASADNIVFDLSLVDDIAGRTNARAGARAWLASSRRQVLAGPQQKRWVRIGPIKGAGWRDDLAIIMQGAPDGLVLPGATGPDDVQTLSAEVYEYEQSCGVANGSIRILPVVSDTPAAALTIANYVTASLPRLFGLAWDGNSLIDAMGLDELVTDENCELPAVARFSRAQCLLSAYARGVHAIDLSGSYCSTAKAAKRIAQEARAEGFHGMATQSPDCLSTINEVFAERGKKRAQGAAMARTTPADHQHGAIIEPLDVSPRKTDRRIITAI